MSPEPRLRQKSSDTYHRLCPLRKGSLSHCMSNQPLPHAPPCHRLPEGENECRAINSFQFNKYLLNTCYVPSAALHSDSTRMNGTQQFYYKVVTTKGVYFSSLYNSHPLRNVLQTGACPVCLEPQSKLVVTSSCFHFLL